jgi:uncharacterized membrane protein
MAVEIGRTRADKIALSGVFMAVIMAFTYLGVAVGIAYIHLGDAFIFLAAIIIGGRHGKVPAEEGGSNEKVKSYYIWYGAFAAGAGSALVNLARGMVFYAPATFVIKALMVIIVAAVLRNSPRNSHSVRSLILAFGLASLFMQAGYLIYSTIWFGAFGGIAHVLIEMIQSAVAIPLGVLLYKAIKGYL